MLDYITIKIAITIIFTPATLGNAIRLTSLSLFILLSYIIASNKLIISQDTIA